MNTKSRDTSQAQKVATSEATLQRLRRIYLDPKGSGWWSQRVKNAMIRAGLVRYGRGTYLVLATKGVAALLRDLEKRHDALWVKEATESAKERRVLRHRVVAKPKAVKVPAKKAKRAVRKRSNHALDLQDLAAALGSPGHE